MLAPRILIFELRASGFGLRALGFGLWALGFGLWALQDRITTGGIDLMHGIHNSAQPKYAFTDLQL